MFNANNEPSLGKTAKAVLITVAITAFTNHMIAWAVEEVKKRVSPKKPEADKKEADNSDHN
jgi:hypothetical protein